MDQHVKARLTKVLDAEGLDALVATTPRTSSTSPAFARSPTRCSAASSSTGCSRDRGWGS